MLSTQLQRFCHSQGKKRAFLLVVLGGILTSAFAPLFFWPAAIVSLSCFLLIIRHSRSAKQAFWDGWWFGLGHFTTGLYWFAHALLTDAEQFAWLIPFAVLGIPAVLACYIALAACVTRIVAKTLLQQWLALALFWLVSEFLRAHLLSGFPWNLLGYIWGASDITIQSASLVGIWGLSLLSILFCASPALLFSSDFSFQKNSLKYVAVSFALFVGLFGYGVIRLHQADAALMEDRNEGVSKTYIRLVQGNIPQHHKWDKSRQMHILKTYIDLTKAPSKLPLSLVIWPESAMPFLPQEQRWIKHVVADALPAGTFLTSGALRAAYTPPNPENFQIWNSLFTFDDGGNIVSYYDKNHLVPFGEYIPFREWVPLKKITEGGRDFSQGDGLKTLRISDIPPFSPLICYEVIFPDRVTNQSRVAPKWMLNITNDAWFGISSGPYQHLHMSRFRAAEEGIPLLRAANTGVSAIIDSYGRIKNSIPLENKGIIDAELPQSITGKTIYQNYGGHYLIISLLIMMLYIFRRLNL